VVTTWSGYLSLAARESVEFATEIASRRINSSVFDLREPSLMRTTTALAVLIALLAWEGQSARVSAECVTINASPEQKLKDYP
jgi:hypothetical protein